MSQACPIETIKYLSCERLYYDCYLTDKQMKYVNEQSRL